MPAHCNCDARTHPRASDIFKALPNAIRRYSAIQQIENLRYKEWLTGSRNSRIVTLLMITKVFWLFGRSGAGKTTLAQRLRGGFVDRNIPVFLIDGDEMRSGLCSDLAFSSEARIENHRRIAEVARLAANQGMNVVVSTMAPEHRQRDAVQKVLEHQL